MVSLQTVLNGIILCCVMNLEILTLTSLFTRVSSSLWCLIDSVYMFPLAIAFISHGHRSLGGPTSQKWILEIGSLERELDISSLSFHFPCEDFLNENRCGAVPEMVALYCVKFSMTRSKLISHIKLNVLMSDFTATNTKLSHRPVGGRKWNKLFPQSPGQCITPPLPSVTSQYPVMLRQGLCANRAAAHSVVLPS